MALRAFCHATGAERFFASGTVLEACPADVLLAAPTEIDALVTEVAVAHGAVAGSILARRVTAVRADDAAPVRERYIGGIGVVGVEHRAHEREEVAYPAARQGRLNGSPSVAGAELLVAHVGVRDVPVGGGGVRIERYDAERGVELGLADARSVEPDLEVAEEHPFELDGVGDDRDVLRFAVELELPEFRFGLPELLVDLPQGRHAGPKAIQRPLRVGCAVGQVGEYALRLLGQRLRCRVPPPLRAVRQPPLDGLQFAEARRHFADLVAHSVVLPQPQRGELVLDGEGDPGDLSCGGCHSCLLSCGGKNGKRRPPCPPSGRLLSLWLEHPAVGGYSSLTGAIVSAFCSSAVGFTSSSALTCAQSSLICDVDVASHTVSSKLSFSPRSVRICRPSSLSASRPDSSAFARLSRALLSASSR